MECYSSQLAKRYKGMAYNNPLTTTLNITCFGLVILVLTLKMVNMQKDDDGDDTEEYDEDNTIVT